MLFQVPQTVFQTPTKFFLVAGDADGLSSLNAFDLALIRAGVGDTNLIKLSSILPPGCEQIEPIIIPPGSLLPVAYASTTSELYYEVLSSAVAIGIPVDKTQAGLIMEYSERGSTSFPPDAERHVRGMVEWGMKQRDREIEKIISISATHQVKDFGATFAAVVMWV